MRVHLHSSLPMAVILALMLHGCSDRDSPTAPGGVARPLPAKFSMIGPARSTAPDGATVDCLLELFFELGTPQDTPGMIEYPAVHGGAIQRTVLDSAGDGISLWPHVHGDAVVRSIAPDRIEISIPVNAEAASRFWRGLSFFEGTLDSDSTATGTWTCAPFDIDEGGWVDEHYSATGSWTLTPTP